MTCRQSYEDCTQPLYLTFSHSYAKKKKKSTNRPQSSPPPFASLILRYQHLLHTRDQTRTTIPAMERPVYIMEAGILDSSCLEIKRHANSNAATFMEGHDAAQRSLVIPTMVHDRCWTSIVIDEAHEELLTKSRTAKGFDFVIDPRRRSTSSVSFRRVIRLGGMVYARTMLCRKGFMIMRYSI